MKPACKKLFICAIAFASTLLALPAAAVQIPDVPLQSGTPYPAPNIMFILDDSGSMEYTDMMAPGMPDVDESDYCSGGGCGGQFDEDKSFLHNTIYYNPAIDYEPWRLADGTRHAGGTSMEAAFSDASLARGTAGSFWNPNQPNDISGNTYTYFVPKDGAKDASDITEYYRYQIREVDNDGVSGQRVVRSEFGRAGSKTTVIAEYTGQSRNSTGTIEFGPISVPNGTDSLLFETYGGSGNADLYVQSRYWQGNRWRFTDECNDTGNGNNHSCEVDRNLSRDFVVTLDAPRPNRWSQGSFNNVTLKVTALVTSANTGVAGAGCSTSTSGWGWRDCTFETPVSGRSESAELENFATWYSYHRTRMKVAKAGVSEAFHQLGDNYRVGFDSIWNRNGSSSVAGDDPAFPIPVDSDGGLFTQGGSNREKWYDYVHRAVGNGGTPLHDALRRAGEYFETAKPWESGDGAEISCRLSFAILTTDGYWNSRALGTSGYGGDVDGTAGPLIERPENVDGSDFQYQPRRPFNDGRSNTLADVAMHYWKRDLRPTLANNVPESDDDPAFWQHMATFGLSIGLAGELNPNFDLPALTDGSKSWPNPQLSNTSGTAEFASRIDDLWHATVNGHGKFVVATDPDEFVNGLISALSTIAERPGSASNVTANSTSFNTDTRVYQASYVSGRWSGDLKAYVATSAGVASTPEWAASNKFPETRSVFTWDGSGGSVFPTEAQISALDQSGREHAPATGTQNAAYIAGDQSLEIINDGKLRNRATVLGDIVNSSPMYVKDSETLFVGANDGMLHAFDATSGEERFAYVPGGISLSALAKLSDPRYGGPEETHKYFVDGPIAVSAKSQTPGKNYLVGALGRGGKGLFGLDVTDPDDFEDEDVLWEFTSDDDLGMVLGEPLVVTLNDTNKTKAVIVSNGINSTSGHAVLFVLDIATGAVIRKIDTGVGSDNGLSSPRGADTNLDGTVDTVYAGDLKGNLWKFDLSDSDVDEWGIANSGSPLFVARDAANARQPITAGLAIAKHPDSGDIWVFAGTGSFISMADLTSTSVQSLYGIIDSGSVVAGRTSSGSGDLKERDIIVVGTTAAGRPVRGFEEAQSTLESGKKGWFIDLDTPSTGERVVSGLRVLGTALIASSIVPPSGSTCDAGGSGFINALDAFTGTSTGASFFDINGDGRVDADDQLDAKDGSGNSIKVPAGSVDLGIGMPTRPTIIDKLLVVGGSTGRIGSITINPQGIGARRISWREVRED